MSGPAQPADRYDPLPGLLGLPAYLWRKLSPRGRRVTAVVGLLLLAGVIATAIVLGPRIAESNRERAAEQRLAERRAAAEERERRAAEQRPRTGTLAAGAAAIAGVEREITRDAAARLASGELDTRVRRTECRRAGRDAGRLLLACTAITSEVSPSEDVQGVTIGYPYQGAVSPTSGRYGFCKTSGRPAEGLLGRDSGPVELPRACGG